MVSPRPPSVDTLARELGESDLAHPLRVEAARAAIEAKRARPDIDLSERVRLEARRIERRLLQRVINATGTLLHTNLGRAPFGCDLDAGYTNLELDLVDGKRGSRSAHTASLLARACGAESVLVVNNGAAAVLLVLAALAQGRGVAVSRAELVEIGGGFRVPEVMEQSGAHLVEVGTTNRTRLADFEHAADDDDADIALLLRVHQSNYRIVGFTESVSTGQLAAITTSDRPLVHDIGSGLLDAACPWLEHGPPPWLGDEPAARQTLAQGAGLVTFSGDKLLGGPQAGIIAGDADLVRRCSAHPLARALRPGGLVLGALGEVALAYLRRDGDAIPFWRLATTPVDVLEERAHRLTGRLPVGAGVAVERCESIPGGGTLPGQTIPSAGLVVDHDVVGPLREADPPVIARVEQATTVLDLRTVLPDQDPQLAAALRGALDAQR